MPDDLGRVLELLHTSRRRWRTLRASGEQWHDGDRSEEAFRSVAPRGRVTSFRGAPGPDDRDPQWRLWVSQPGRARSELGQPHGWQATVIADGRMVWMSVPGGGGRACESRDDDVLTRLGPAGRLLETATLPAILDLDVVEEATVIGRPAIRVRGRPRRDGAPRSWAEAMAVGADEIELAVDAERGVLLGMEARFGGAAFHRLSVTEITFDEELPADLFDFPRGDPSTAGRTWAAAAPSPPPRPPRVVDGPPDGVIGEPLALTTVLALAPSVVVAVDRVIAYPIGFELHVTVRTQAEAVIGSFDAGHPRRWSGASAFPGESLGIGVVFADGRRAFSSNFGDMPEGTGVQLVALNGSGTQSRLDQRFWVAPLPPTGPLGLVVSWSGRDIPETRVDISADAVIDAATRAMVLWEI